MPIIAASAAGYASSTAATIVFCQVMAQAAYPRTAHHCGTDVATCGRKTGCPKRFQQSTNQNISFDETADVHDSTIRSFGAYWVMAANRPILDHGPIDCDKSPK